MAKVVLVQYWMLDHLGPMTISACLKERGHNVDILVKHEEKRFLTKIASLKPDVIGFACTSGIHLVAVKDALSIKKILPNIITLMGGPHPTFVPEIIEEDGLDIICRGEGEEALVELCDRIDQGKPYNDVLNLWVKSNGNIFKNELRPLIENLDALPFPDREYYNSYKILKKMPTRTISTGRGCVFNCTFCYVGALKSMYKGKGKFVRRRSVNHVIEEIKQLKENQYVKYISFEDDDMLDGHEWILDFCNEYKKQIDLPYFCLARFDNLTEDVVRSLKDSGCYLIALGIDSGNEKIRQKLLNKSLPVDEIIYGAGLLKKYNLKFKTYNILGSPGETVDEALDTLTLNRTIGADFPTAFIWTPYPGTPLAKYMASKGNGEVNNSDFPQTIINKSIVKQDNIAELENLQKLFSFLVKMQFSKTLIKKLLKTHVLRPVYWLIYNLIYLLDISKRTRVSLLRSVIYCLKMHKIN